MPIAFCLHPCHHHVDCKRAHPLHLSVTNLNPIDVTDYGTSEVYPQWHAFECKCGSKDCRGALTPFDWRTLHMQRKYAGHFLVHVAESVAQTHSTVRRSGE